MPQITEDHIQHAFNVLHSKDHALARAAYEFTEKQLKVILAKAVMSSNGKTVSERETSALCSPEYIAALEDYKGIAELYYRHRDRREAAVAIIDAWRTQRSDERAMGKVG